MVNVHAALSSPAYHSSWRVTRVRRRVSVESADAGRLVRKSVVTLFPYLFFSFFFFFFSCRKGKKKIKVGKRKKGRNREERKKETRQKGWKRDHERVRIAHSHGIGTTTMRYGGLRFFIADARILSQTSYTQNGLIIQCVLFFLFLFSSASRRL